MCVWVLGGREGGRRGGGEEGGELFSPESMADDFHLPSGLGDEQVAIRSDILNSVILQQQKRIAELEHKFQASQTEIQRLKRSLNGSRKGLASNGKAKGLPEIRKHRSRYATLKKVSVMSSKEQ